MDQRKGTKVARRRTVGHEVGRAAELQRVRSGEGIEARSRIDTAGGPLEVTARSRGDRWAVRAVCAGREGNGLASDLGTALMGALELCGVDAAELER